MNRKKLLTEVDQILVNYCDGCFLKSHYRKEFGKAYAQNFCIKKCTVGEKLQEYGKKLS